jgi:hypothetical protein
LVDEPDAHLHPATQELLVKTLSEAARFHDTQVILTTHSPSVVRSLPPGASVVWMRNGATQPDGDTVGRQLMGWGLLDKRILLLTEDTKTEMLRSILSQWPDLERVTAIWPVHGSGKLLDAGACASLRAILGDSMKLILHRDRDFMMPQETQALEQPYIVNGLSVWFTRSSDIESYFAEADIISHHYSVELDIARAWLDKAIARCKNNDEDLKCRNKKRHANRNQPPLNSMVQKGLIDNSSDPEVVEEYRKAGDQHVVLGKTLCEALRAIAQDDKAKAPLVFGSTIPPSLSGKIAPDLRDLLAGLA